MYEKREKRKEKGEKRKEKREEKRVRRKKKKETAVDDRDRRLIDQHSDQFGDNPSFSAN